MPGIIFDIKRFAIHDGPGIRATVFLKGCPLRCTWCHNPEGWDPEPCCAEKKILLDGREFSERETIGRSVTVEEVMAEIRKERMIMEESGGGVTFSGGEPLMQPQFLKEILETSEAEGFHTTVDTSGYALRSSLEMIFPATGLFLYDIKLINDARHIRYTGVSNAIILENFKWLARQGKPVRVRIPLIRGITATMENIREVTGFLAPFRKSIEQVDLLPYHRTGLHKYRKLGIGCEMPEPEAVPGNEETEEISRVFLEEGFLAKRGG